MTPELIALLLAAPLDVRLALLDADPKGAGWFVGEYGASVYANPTCYCHLDSFKWLLKEGRAAWLPCNPLAIAEHAARLHGGGLDAHLVSANWGVEASLCETAHYGRIVTLSQQDKCPYTAAVRLLAEVVGPLDGAAEQAVAGRPALRGHLRERAHVEAGQTRRRTPAPAHQ